MEKLFFLSGLPRSGSTVLGSILNQNPDIHVTPTSPLFELLLAVQSAFTRFDKHFDYKRVRVVFDVNRAILRDFHASIKERYVIDKHRGWPTNVDPVRSFTGHEVKIVCNIRRISEILASFIRLIEGTPNNFIDGLMRQRRIEINNANRADFIWDETLTKPGQPYDMMALGMKNHRENLHLVEYDDLVGDPEKAIEGIYNFLGIKPFRHAFDNIENTCAEENADWGLESLHDIRPRLGKTSLPPEEVIGEDKTRYYDTFNIKGD